LQLTYPPLPSTWSNFVSLPNPSSPPVPSPLLSTNSIEIPKSPTSGTPRKRRTTLTDETRREICRLYENDQTLKQAEIAGRFGIKRSTVSKVLRDKNKFLNPTKKQSVTADIEEKLMIWIKLDGLPRSNQELRNKAILFCQNTPGTSNLRKIIKSTARLEIFKQRHGLKFDGINPRPLKPKILQTSIMTVPPLAPLYPMASGNTENASENGFKEESAKAGISLGTQETLSPCLWTPPNSGETFVGVGPGLPGLATHGGAEKAINTPAKFC
ncbi:hypothetical protein PoMZ_10025, partial [Pyricularia oryzae]